LAKKDVLKIVILNKYLKKIENKYYPGLVRILHAYFRDALNLIIDVFMGVFKWEPSLIWNLKNNVIKVES
jgi:hypothetical protein